MGLPKYVWISVLLSAHQRLLCFEFCSPMWDADIQGDIRLHPVCHNGSSLAGAHSYSGNFGHNFFIFFVNFNKLRCIVNIYNILYNNVFFPCVFVPHYIEQFFKYFNILLLLYTKLKLKTKINKCCRSTVYLLVHFK